jgi:hypothetical protein
MIPLRNAGLIDANGIYPERHQWILLLCNEEEVHQIGPDMERVAIDENLVLNIGCAPKVAEASV